MCRAQGLPHGIDKCKGIYQRVSLQLSAKPPPADIELLSGKFFGPRYFVGDVWSVPGRRGLWSAANDDFVSRSNFKRPTIMFLRWSTLLMATYQRTSVSDHQPHCFDFLFTFDFFRFIRTTRVMLQENRRSTQFRSGLHAHKVSGSSRLEIGWGSFIKTTQYDKQTSSRRDSSRLISFFLSFQL